MDFEEKENMQMVKQEPQRVLVDSITNTKANEIFYNTKKIGHNLHLARQTVEAAIYSGRIKREDIVGRCFPGTTMQLEELLDPTTPYTEKELEAIEEPLIKPLQTINQQRTQDEVNKGIQPKDNPRHFEDYGADWLKQKIEEQKDIEAQRAILLSDQKKTM